MSYPQPNSNAYVTGGYQFFPLSTLLSSPGDIYESEVGSHALCVGPDSDIANVAVAYFDGNVSTFMAQAIISPERALVGEIYARNEATYSPAGRPGKILFWPDDIYDPNFRPTGFDPDSDHMEFVTPRLEVFQYFAPIPSLGPARNDKTFVFQNYDASSTTFIVLPYYGRKYAYVDFTNRTPVAPANIQIIGVNYVITDDSSGTPYHQETELLASTSVITDATVTKIITAATDGCFDALVIAIAANGPAPLRVVTSDQAQR